MQYWVRRNLATEKVQWPRSVGQPSAWTLPLTLGTAGLRVGNVWSTSLHCSSAYLIRWKEWNRDKAIDRQNPVTWLKEACCHVCFQRGARKKSRAKCWHQDLAIPLAREIMLWGRPFSRISQDSGQTHLGISLGIFNFIRGSFGVSKAGVSHGIWRKRAFPFVSWRLSPPQQAGKMEVESTVLQSCEITKSSIILL